MSTLRTSEIMFRWQNMNTFPIKNQIEKTTMLLVHEGKPISRNLFDIDTSTYAIKIFPRP